MTVLDTDCMRAVLGIDAAWTATRPSGVALAVEETGGWRLIAAVSSYRRFHALAAGDHTAELRPSGSTPDAAALLASATHLCGRPVDLVAVDMPLAHSPIAGRRASDNALSRTYGARKCATHSPSAERPGCFGDRLRESFHNAGYPLRTDRLATPGVIEVYPHPALVELSGAAERLPYKCARAAGYWPSAPPAERRVRLLAKWREIAALLDAEVAGATAALPKLRPGATGVEMKAYEDALDAIVCAWVAIIALGGRARAFGDAQSAIWVPLPQASARPKTAG